MSQLPISHLYTQGGADQAQNAEKEVPAIQIVHLIINFSLDM